MCTQITTLARSNDFRYILQCEHKTIHLSWDLVTLYLNLSEFERLVGLLEQGTRLVKPTKLTESRCMVIYREQGFYQVWVRNVGVNLTPVDFRIFLDMARSALKVAHDNQAQWAPRELMKAFRQTDNAWAGSPFSIN